MVQWDKTALSRWDSRAEEIVLFANIENPVIDIENGNQDLTEILGFCLWDKVAMNRADKVAAGCFHVFANAGKICMAWGGQCYPEVYDSMLRKCIDDPAAEYVRTRPIARRPDSPGYFSRARKYLDDCLQQVGIHAECNASATGKAPTRLLEINRPPQGDYSLRIREPTGPVKYIALSYCWGGDQLHKTTRERLPAYSVDIQWANLPKTIQDAVKITAALDARYLWVDSLCIIQDDDDDKVREIADMPNIYNEATVTIVAGAAKTAGEGFLHERNLEMLTGSAFKLPFRSRNGRMGSVYLTETGDLEFDEHIDTRAWTLQESYLSKRLLRFNSKQCNLMCQCSPSKPHIIDGWKIDQDYDVRYVENIIFPRKLDLQDDVEGIKNFYKSTFGIDLMYDVGTPETALGDFVDMWRELVEAYTTRDLSVPMDRCLAISGLADRIAPVLNTRYVAGHWEKFLPADLLWHVSTPRPKPQEYQGPSWSWTSVNSLLSFKNAIRDMSLEIENVDIELQNPKVLFGTVKRGSLRVCGKLLKTYWAEREVCTFHDGSPKTLFSRAILADMIKPDTTGMDLLESGAVTSSTSEPGRGGSAGQDPPKRPVDPTQEPIFYFLEICAPGSRTGPGSIGLVLQKGAISQTSSKFARVGLFDFAVHSEVGKPEGVPAEEWQVFLDRHEHIFDGLEASEIELE